MEANIFTTSHKEEIDKLYCEQELEKEKIQKEMEDTYKAQKGVSAPCLPHISAPPTSTRPM
eukprot:15328151-Ditylum_brightwellii.AAC.1